MLLNWNLFLALHEVNQDKKIDHMKSFIDKSDVWVDDRSSISLLCVSFSVGVWDIFDLLSYN